MDSEKIKTYLKDFRITLPLGVVLGLILGLVIGWGLWPVQWTDLAPHHLRPDLREDYLRMAIYSSTAVGDASIANKAWYELGETADETLQAVQGDPLYLTDGQINRFVGIVGAELTDPLPPLDEPEPIEDVMATRGVNWLLLGGLCIGFLLLTAAAIYFLVIRGLPTRDKQPETLAARGSAQDDVGFEEDEMRYAPSSQNGIQAPYEDEQPLPMAQFMTTFLAGDDFYDDSFSIDAPTGEFMGECGVGISETVGVGEPKRVAAFEIWLFDKNDIQTVTKVIMSEHAYENEKIRMRLESKGEMVLAEPGKQVLLETATLQLEARIVDMEYGQGAAPDQSFFQRLTLDLAVWPKERPIT